MDVETEHYMQVITTWVGNNYKQIINKLLFMKRLFLVCTIALLTFGAFSVVGAETKSTSATESMELDKSTDLRGWTFYANCKLYYKVDGEWYYYGTYPVYFNNSDNKDGCNQWVRFEETGFSPAVYHDNKRIKWPRRVQWRGVQYYF